MAWSVRVAQVSIKRIVLVVLQILVWLALMLLLGFLGISSLDRIVSFINITTHF
jgi:hypothetical protein